MALRAHVCDVIVSNNDVSDVVNDSGDIRIRESLFDMNDVILVQDHNELQYVNVCVMDDDLNKCDLVGLVDSGTEISVRISSLYIVIRMLIVRLRH